MVGLKWFCIFCEPQKEFLTRHVLETMGLAAKVPQEFRYIKGTGRNKGRVNVKAYPVLGSRYLFVGATEYPATLLRSVHMVTGVVRSGSEIAVFTEKAVKKLDESVKRPYNDTIDRTQLHKTFRLGEAVRITQGPFEGHNSRIVEVQGGSLRVLIALLGGTQAIWLSADHVEH